MGLGGYQMGYDVNTYKTVRTQEFPSHPFPNVLFIDTQGELHPDKTPRLIGKKHNDSDEGNGSKCN